MENKKLISYSLVLSLLLVFGFYSTTIMYADAITLSNFTVTAYDLRGSTYNSANNSWYFASTNNNTMVRITDNTTSPTFLPVNGNGNCADPMSIQSLEHASDSYIALWCDNGAIATHGLMIRDRVTNEEKDFENNIFATEDGFRIVEWDNGNKIYVINHGAGAGVNIAVFDETKINSTTSSMLIAQINLSATCTILYDAVINEADSLMYLTCQQLATNLNRIAVFDLQSSLVSQYVTLTGTSDLGTIDYNTDTEQIVVTLNTANDLLLIDAGTMTGVYNNTSICSGGLPVSPQFNENTNQIYFICNTTATGANTIQLFDIASQTLVASFPAGSGPNSALGGTNHWPLIHWEDNKVALYGTFGFLDDTGSGAVFNTITRISDTTSAPSEDPNAEFCADPANANILTCRLDDIPPITGASELLNQSSTNIICQIGLIECIQDENGNFTPVNGDIKTNGVGYILLVITFGVVISIMWLASGGRLNDIPTFIWFIITLSILGVFVGFDWLDITFLLVGIIAIIALAVARIKGLFGDTGLFKGE